MSDGDGIEGRHNRSQEEVDKINKVFYGKFNYPWPPMTFPAFTRQQFVITMLNQDIGDWEHKTVPARPKIWVAGCGTNQAVFTALKFPDSEVLGTDLSTESLKTCENSAGQLGITNLTLEEKSINGVPYKDEFDVIICTGVIHHNADPKASLAKLSAALKPGGILELMVYNYYHMLFEAAYQEAIRGLCGEGGPESLEKQLAATKKFIHNFPGGNMMANHLSRFKNVHDDAELADMLLQPVLHSYTVDAFLEMVSHCSLECLLHCINHFDKSAKRLTWNMEFDDPEVAQRYELLPDDRRWQISNLLMMERSPMLWFYLQRNDSTNRRKSEKEVCDEFLNTKFEKHSTLLKEYLLDREGKYVMRPGTLTLPSPPVPPDELARKIFNIVNPNISMKSIFSRLNIETSIHNVNRVRVNLATSAFPYLKAVSSEKTVGKKVFAKDTRQDKGDFGF